MSTDNVSIYLTTPTISLFLANYNSIMTAYNNLINELSNSTSNSGIINTTTNYQPHK